MNIAAAADLPTRFRRFRVCAFDRDGNEALGFRDYGFAARMLDALGMKPVRFHTNNPRKLECLTRRSLHVSAGVRHVMTASESICCYLDERHGARATSSLARRFVPDGNGNARQSIGVEAPARRGGGARMRQVFSGVSLLGTSMNQRGPRRCTTSHAFCSSASWRANKANIATVANAATEEIAA
jgi:hypothetical protein